jgi:hypothetical protein
MVLGISERTVRRKTCGDCGVDYDHVTGFIDDGDTSVAAYFAYCHGHPDHEAGIDAVLGTWGLDRHDDHVMFSCLLRGAEGAMAVDSSVAIEPTADAAILGRRLTRDEALAHPWIARFWQVVDVIAVEDDAVRTSAYGISPPD